MSASAVDIRRDVVYRAVNSHDLHVDVYLPRGGTVGPRPAVVYFHGGSWSRGSRTDFADERLDLSLAEMAPISRTVLKRPLGDVRSREDDIRRALDRLFTGF